MIFIDASFFLAYYNIDDLHHQNAKKGWAEIEVGKYGPTITSDYILNEVVGVTLRKLNKKHAIIIGEQIIRSIIIINIDEPILTEAWRLFLQTGFNFNLVDCTTIAIMKRTNMKHIATFDKAFKNIRDIIVIER